MAIADTSSNYVNIPGVNHVVINPNMAAHYNQWYANIDKLNSMTKSVQDSKGLSLIGTFDVAFNSVFTVIALLWQTIAIYTGMAAFIPQDVNFLPNAPIVIFVSSLLAIVTVYLILVWLSSIMRGKI